MKKAIEIIKEKWGAIVFLLIQCIVISYILAEFGLSIYSSLKIVVFVTLIFTMICTIAHIVLYREKVKEESEAETLTA